MHEILHGGVGETVFGNEKVWRFNIGTMDSKCLLQTSRMERADDAVHTNAVLGLFFITKCLLLTSDWKWGN